MFNKSAIAVLLMMAASTSQAATQSLDAVARMAEGFAAGRAQASASGPVEVKAGRLDNRLRLAACDRPLEAFSPPGSRPFGRITVGVRCSGSKPWTLFVPVRVDVFGQVVVAAEPLARGERLDQNKVKVARYSLSRLPQGYFHDPSQVIGMILKRNLAAGQPLVPNMLKAERLIARGQRVTMVAGSGGLQVRMPGEALAAGARGERIRVRNLSSHRIVEGWVVKAGLVRVDR